MLIREWSLDELSVVDVSGPLTLEAGTAVRDTVRAAFARGRRKLVLDLTRVTALDATGLGELAHVHHMSALFGAEVKLVHRSPAVSELLKRSRLSSLFETFQSEAAALVSFDRDWRQPGPAEGVDRGSARPASTAFP